MKILLLTQVLPFPPDSGPKIKTFHLLKALASRHQVTLASFVRGNQSRDEEVLRSLGIDVHTRLMERSKLRDGLALLSSFRSGDPWVITRDQRKSMQELVEQLSTRSTYDLVIADQLNMAQYARKVTGASKILDAHNALWLLYQRVAKTGPQGPFRWLLERDWRLLKRYEGRVCRDFDAVIAVSDVDRQALFEAADGKALISVTPIAVDTESLQAVQRNPNADRIVSIGTMFWPPNIDGMEWFLKDVYPAIKAGRPGTIVEVIGAKPPHRLVQMGETDPGIQITGYLEDVLPSLEQAAVFIVPLLSGGGMRVKILDALARAMPVVTTTIGAEGIAVIPGKHLLIADTAEEFSAAVLSLLSNRELGEQLGQAGRKLVQDRYDQHLVYENLEEIYFPNGKAYKAEHNRQPEISGPSR